MKLNVFLLLRTYLIERKKGRRKREQIRMDLNSEKVIGKLYSSNFEGKRFIFYHTPYKYLARDKTQNESNLTFLLVMDVV